MDLKIKAVSNKIGKEIPLPYYATPGSAAMDLHACIDEAVTIPAGGRRTIPTGIAIALPSADYVALVYARSGLAVKLGVAPANCVGVIDSDYRGEIPLRVCHLPLRREALEEVQPYVRFIQEQGRKARGAGAETAL